MSQPATSTTVRSIAELFGFHAEGIGGNLAALVLPMSDTSEYSLMRQDAPVAPRSLHDRASLAYHTDGELARLYHGKAGALLAFLYAKAEQPLPFALLPFNRSDLVEEIPCL